MNAYQFMSDSPWLAFFLALIFAQVLSLPFRLLNRWIRHKNIKAQGWPPAHLDADGDFDERSSYEELEDEIDNAFEDTYKKH